MITCAQTNVQLLNQLTQAGYRKGELVLVRDAYRLGMELFGGLFRASGKPFLAHAVGTASLLVSLDQSAEVVAAGLLHAAYFYGDFGNGSRGLSATKRRKVRSAVGKKVEELIFLYTQLPWGRQVISLMEDGVESLSRKFKQVLLLRLANELEDCCDRDILYSGYAHPYRQNLRAYQSRAIQLARRIEVPRLALLLKQAFRQILSDKIPPYLRNRERDSFSVFKKQDWALDQESQAQ